MKKEICLICIICFILGWFIHNIISKCGFTIEHNIPPMCTVAQEDGTRKQMPCNPRHVVLRQSDNN